MSLTFPHYMSPARALILIHVRPTCTLEQGFGIKEGGDWRPWVYHMTGVGASFLQWKFEGFGESLTFGDVGEQLGGYVVSFNSNFTFLTIHGSGHMVPEYKVREYVRIDEPCPVLVCRSGTYTAPHR